MTASRIEHLLGRIYDASTARDVADRITRRYSPGEGSRRSFQGGDSVLITYADTLSREGEKPLVSLEEFVRERLPEINHVHLLPFFPASGDGGFAVIDFRSVDPVLGSWEDVSAFARHRRLMVDLVLNHMSVDSEWFRAFLAGDTDYAEWFHSLPPDSDTRAVFRPRTHPLLTPYPTDAGMVHVWTTFSPKQADLNFAHPRVLEEIIDVMMTYVARGASVIRLDAVGYLWKEAGTTCLHHPKTHLIVQLLRSVLDYGAPHVALVTETNVPHIDNISYFGSGGDEAQMVYNFSLPPLVLDAFLRRDTSLLTGWASGLSSHPSGTFLNFLASHDGIGLTPVNGLLPPETIQQMATATEEAGGLWSGRTTDDGSVRPYELNIGFIDALGMGDGGDDRKVVDRFLAAVSIQMALRGVPGIYIHSALGTRSWWEGPRITGEPRSINRERLDIDRVTSDLASPGHLQGRVLQGHRRMLKARADSGAFDPSGHQEIHDLGRELVSIVRAGSGGEVWAVTNVSAETVEVDPPPSWRGRRRCLLTGETEEGRVTLAPYEYRWFER